MTKVMATACFTLAAALGLAQPVLAQDAVTMKPYSQVDAEQRAYEQGRADEAASRAGQVATPPPSEDPAYQDTRRAASQDDRGYDGYCYQRQAHARTTGTIVGALAGALIGNSVSNRWDRGSNMIGGAMVGGMLGSAVGSDSVACYRDAYYSYDDGYYSPPPPPRGYVTVFFTSRPSYYGGYHRGYGDRGYYGRSYYSRDYYGRGAYGRGGGYHRHW